MLVTENKEILTPRKLSIIKIIKSSDIFLSSDTASQIYQEFIQSIKKNIEFIVIDLRDSLIISQGGVQIIKLCKAKADKFGIQLFIYSREEHDCSFTFL